LNPQRIFFGRKYPLVFRSLKKSVVNPNLCAIISSTYEKSGLVTLAYAEPAADSVGLMVVGFQDSQVRHMTLNELDQRKIWYEPAGDNAIRFRAGDLEDVTRIVKKFTYEILPPDRSASCDEPVLTEFLRRLDKERVGFFGTPWRRHYAPFAPLRRANRLQNIQRR
jgi:hypothetical protein